MVEVPMIPHPSLNWNEILAAYADGEFEGRDDLAVLRRRVEDWLASHPEASAELAEIRRLKRLWQATTPSSPSSGKWTAVLRELERTPAEAKPRGTAWRRPAALAAALAASIALVVALGSFERPRPLPHNPPVAVEEAPLPVAAANEVEILHVDGADTHTLVVGELPLQGPILLAGPGDVTVTSIQPAARDNMVPEVNTKGPGRPMIWARAETEDD